MAFGGGVAAGKAYVEFLINDTKFKKSLANVAGKLKSIGSIGAAATAPLIAGFTLAAKTFASAGDELDKMRHRVGVSVEALSGLKFAAEQTGASGDILEKGFSGLSRTFFEAKRGAAVAVDALGEIGLKFEDLEGLSPEDQLKRIADGLKDVESESIRGAVAQKIFGRAGRQLLPMLSLGAEGMEKLKMQASDLGFVLSDEDAVAAADLTDAMNELWNQFKGFTIQVGAAIAGPLTEFIRKIQPIITDAIRWIKANRVLVATVAAVTAAVAAASAALVTFGIVLTIVSAHPILAFLTLIAAIVVGLATYFGLASDGADEFADSLDKIQKDTGVTADSTAKSRSEAAAIETKLNAAIATGSPEATAAPVVDSPQLRAQLGELIGWAEDTAKGIRRLVQLAQSGEAGFFSVGAR